MTHGSNNLVFILPLFAMQRRIEKLTLPLAFEILMGLLQCTGWRGKGADN